MFLLLLPKVVFFCFLTPGVFLNLMFLSTTQILWPNSVLVIISYGVLDISLDIQTMFSGLKENFSVNKRKVMYMLRYFMHRTFTRQSKLIFFSLQWVADMRYIAWSNFCIHYRTQGTELDMTALWHNIQYIREITSLSSHGTLNITI